MLYRLTDHFFQMLDAIIVNMFHVSFTQCTSLSHSFATAALEFDPVTELDSAGSACDTFKPSLVLLLSASLVLLASMFL